MGLDGATWITTQGDALSHCANRIELQAWAQPTLEEHGHLCPLTALSLPSYLGSKACLLPSRKATQEIQLPTKPMLGGVGGSWGVITGRHSTSF